MPDSQHTSAFFGSKTIDEARFATRSDPSPSPIRVHVGPEVFVHNPRDATPAMMASDWGTGAISVSVPHSDILWARLPVAFTQASAAAGGAGDCAAATSACAATAAAIDAARSLAIMSFSYLPIVCARAGVDRCIEPRTDKTGCTRPAAARPSGALDGGSWPLRRQSESQRERSRSREAAALPWNSVG